MFEIQRKQKVEIQ